MPQTYIVFRLVLSTQYSAEVLFRLLEATNCKRCAILNPGQKGKKFLARYSEKLVCVRYRYDTAQHECFTTIERIIEEASLSSLEKPILVGVRIERQETNLSRRVKQAGGKWNPAQRVWEIYYDQAIAFGLKARMVKLEVSDSRHLQIANSRHYFRPYNSC